MTPDDEKARKERQAREDQKAQDALQAYYRELGDLSFNDVERVYWQRFRGYAIRKGVPTLDASDIAQEALMRVAGTKYGQFGRRCSSHEPAGPWLWTICHRQVADYFRIRARRPKTASDEPERVERKYGRQDYNDDVVRVLPRLEEMIVKEFDSWLDGLDDDLRPHVMSLLREETAQGDSSSVAATDDTISKRRKKAFATLWTRIVGNASNKLFVANKPYATLSDTTRREFMGLVVSLHRTGRMGTRS